MSDWSEGYVTEVDYTYGFYKEMAPAAMRFALLAPGYEAPSLDRFTYCELGFGQGAGLNLLAAANPQGDFWGTDFNPAHAAGAMQMAAAAGLSNVHAYDDSFEQFAEREMPKFDYITLHGVWSWVGAENWHHIVEFIRKQLKVGGAVYISYNTLPGWTHALPMRGLLSQYVDYQTAPADSISARLDGALKLLTDLSEIPGSYFKATPQLAERIKMLQGQNRNYLAHEYLNRHWTPVFFSQMVEALSAAKLTFAAHANPMNCIDALNHTKELQAVLDKISNPIFKEVVRDLGINQTFRRDIFVRGPRRLPRADHVAGILDTTYALVADRSACAMKVKTTVGEANLQPAVYEPILDKLAEQGPATGHALLALPELAQNGGVQRVLQALIVMVGAGYVQPCVAAALQKPAKASTRRLNELVMARTARGGEAEFPFLASSRLGSGLASPRLPQLFIQASLAKPGAGTRAWAESAWAVLRASGQALIKEGKAIEGDEANVLELVARIDEWKSTSMGLLRHLDVVQ